MHGEIGSPPSEPRRDRVVDHLLAVARTIDGGFERPARVAVAHDLTHLFHVVLRVATVTAGRTIRFGEPEAQLPRPQDGHRDVCPLGDGTDAEGPALC